MGTRVAELVVLGLVFNSLYRAYCFTTRLPKEAYERPFLLVQFVARPANVVFLAAAEAPLLWSWHQLAWENFNGPVRWFTVVLCVLASLRIVLFPANPFFGRSYRWDRATIVCLATLTVIHPAFLGGFVALGLAFHCQIVHPSLYPWAHGIDWIRPKQPWLFFLVAVLAWLYGVALWRADTLSLVVFISVVHASTYFWSAVDKVKISWLRRNNLIGALNTAIAHGRWNVDRKALTRFVASFLTRGNKPILGSVLLLEFLVPLIWCHAGIAMLILFGLIVFHLAVSMIAGIDFRAWTLANVLIAVMILCVRAEFAGQRAAFIFGGFVLLAFAPLLLFPLRLAWFDAHICNIFRFAVVDADEREHELSAADFGPYDVQIERNEFRFLVDQKFVLDTVTVIEEE